MKSLSKNTTLHENGINPYMNQRSRMIMSPGAFGELYFDTSFDDEWNKYMQENFPRYLEKIISDESSFSGIDVICFCTEKMVYVILQSEVASNEEIYRMGEIMKRLELDFSFSQVESFRVNVEWENRDETQKYRKNFQDLKAKILRQEYDIQSKNHIISVLYKKIGNNTISETEVTILEGLETQVDVLKENIDIHKEKLSEVREALYLQMSLDATRLESDDSSHIPMQNVLDTITQQNDEILGNLEDQKATNVPEKIQNTINKTQETEVCKGQLLSESHNQISEISGTNLYCLETSLLENEFGSISLAENYRGFVLPGIQRIQKIYGTKKAGEDGGFNYDLFFAFDGENTYLYEKIENTSTELLEREGNYYKQLPLVDNHKIDMVLYFDVEKEHGVVRMVDGNNAVLAKEKGEYKIIKLECCNDIAVLQTLYRHEDIVRGGIFRDSDNRSRVFSRKLGLARLESDNVEEATCNDSYSNLVDFQDMNIETREGKNIPRDFTYSPEHRKLIHKFGRRRKLSSYLRDRSIVVRPEDKSINKNTYFQYEKVFYTELIDLPGCREDADVSAVYLGDNGDIKYVFVKEDYKSHIFYNYNETYKKVAIGCNRNSGVIEEEYSYISLGDYNYLIESGGKFFEVESIRGRPKIIRNSDGEVTYILGKTKKGYWIQKIVDGNLKKIKIGGLAIGSIWDIHSYETDDNGDITELIVIINGVMTWTEKKVRIYGGRFVIL